MRSLVVCIVREEFDPGVSIPVNAQIHLWTKFRWLWELPTNNRVDEWHMEAHNAVIHPVHFLVKHILLLVINFPDDPNLLLLL